MEEPTQLIDDPEILALLDFEPVPRDRIVKGSWTPERQRELVIRLAEHGSIQMACDDMGPSTGNHRHLLRKGNSPSRGVNPT